MKHITAGSIDMKHSRPYASIVWTLLASAIAPEVSFAQVADSWSISSDVTISASNTNAPVSLIPTDVALLSAPTIADGSRNTISASAVGATASASYVNANDQDAAMAAAVDGDVIVSAINLGSDITLAGTVDGAAIEQGHDNTIALSGVGASAQISVVDDVLGGATVSRSLDINGDITLNAENSGAVSVQTDVAGVEINGGTRNAFSGTAIGASAGVSVLAVVDDGAYSSDISIGSGGLISVTANNSGDVRIGATDDPTQAATLSGAVLGVDSVDGSVSLMAIGASGSVSSTTVVYAGTADPNVVFGEIVFDVVNTGAVEANVTIADASIEGKNSISTGAIGSAMSNSAKSISYVEDAQGVTGTLDSVSFASSNSGSILMAGGLSNSGIASGFSLAIGLNAVGTSASFTLP